MGLFNKKPKTEIQVDISKTACFTGHRPKSLPWGYDENQESCVSFKKDLYNIIKGAINYGLTHFISGLAEGVDMICAETVIELKKEFPNITLEGAIPCPNQDAKWSDISKKRYAKILKQCDKTTMVSDRYTASCMLDRNKYMVDNSCVVIAIWNGNNHSGTANTIRQAKEKGCKIRVINPDNYK
jgi:uncharacterized phage-like protein YoqJ